MKTTPSRPSRRKPAGDRVEALLDSDWKCWFCAADLRHGRFSVTHLKPPTHGGAAARPNLAAACVTCCSRKGGLSLESFRAYFRRRQHREVALAHEITRMADDAVGLIAPECIDAMRGLAATLDAEVPPLVFRGEVRAASDASAPPG